MARLEAAQRQLLVCTAQEWLNDEHAGLKADKANPDGKKKTKLEEQFDELCSTKTCYVSPPRREPDQPSSPQAPENSRCTTADL